MRAGFGTFLLAILVVFPTGFVSAQAPPSEYPPLVVLGDAAGDVGITAAPKVAAQHVNASQYGNGQFDHLDLMKVTFGLETEKDFQITLQLKVLDQPQMSRPQRFVSFSYGRVDWQVLVGGCPMPGGGQAQGTPNTGCIRFRDTGGGYRAVKQIEGSRADGSFTWTIGKDQIFNENRVPGRYGTMLTNISATATQYYAGGGGFNQLDVTGGVYATDRAPQTGYASVPFVFQKGAGGRGHLLMTAPDPIRVTNGEATTIVYKVDLLNRHTESVQVVVATKGGEPDWSMRVPPRLVIEAGQTVSFPVILSLPFRHDHGKTALFNVEAADVVDSASSASTQLGVFWTDVPQPSGHHECDDDSSCGQWFHTSPLDNPAPDQFDTVAPFKNVWFNGIAKDPAPNADDANVPAFFNDYFFCFFRLPNCPAPPTWTSSWFFPMSPSLLMGLDFDVSRTGLARIALLPSLVDPGATLEVQLLYCDPTKQGSGGPGPFTPISSSCYQYQMLLGAGRVSLPLSANTQVIAEVPLKMEAVADLLPYQRGANIGLSVRLITTIPQNTIIVPPRIEFVTKQSHLHMPLLEYHDPVDQQFAELGAVKIQPLDPFEKQVNPGRGALYRFEVTNEDDDAQRLQLGVEGINADWATLHAPNALQQSPPVLLLAPHQKGNFSLLVMAPDQATNEERAELFVVAQSIDEPLIVALSRLRATVVEGSDIPDESGMISLGGGGDSPATGFIFVALALLGLVLARRNRLSR